eukprot:jgi/Bigna1/84842/estExt_fgenesh1_pg.C_10195
MTSTRRAAVIRAVAVIGKENEPLFLQTYTESKEDNQTSLHYHVHTSLDIVEEKIGDSGKVYPNAQDMYLGQLYIVQDLKLYGYATNTKTKFVVVVNGTPSSSSMKSWMRDFHELYIQTTANPFCELMDDKSGLYTTTFMNSVRKRIAAFNEKAIGY